MVQAKYKQILECLVRRIVMGEFDVRHPFPSEAAVAREYHTTRVTAHKAFSVLRQKGFIGGRPGVSPRVTRTGASRKIGLIVPGMAYSEFFPPIVSKISHLAQKGNYALIYGDMTSVGLSGLPHCVKRMSAQLIEEKVAGVICQPVGGIRGAERTNKSVFSAFEQAGIPVVLIDYDCVQPPDRSGHDVVGINNIDAGRSLARHLLSVGAKRIRFLVHENPAPTTLNRLAGVISEVSPSRPGEAVALEAEPGDVATVRRCLKNSRPDAIVCLNDADAAQLMQTLSGLGLSVPRDILVAGFNDVNIAKLTTPPLTTIHQPCDQIAIAAFGRLVARIRNPALPPTELLLPAPLVVRGSTVRSWRPSA